MMVVSKRRIIGSIRPMLVMVEWRQWPRRPDSPMSLFQKGTQIAGVQPSGDWKRRGGEGHQPMWMNAKGAQWEYFGGLKEVGPNGLKGRGRGRSI
jgi:hypothetical protein